MENNKVKDFPETGNVNSSLEGTTIKLTVKNGQIQTATDRPVRIDDLMVVLFSLQLKLLNQFVNNPEIPEKHRQAVKEDLYDKYNGGASTVLEMFAPEIEMRPDITAEALKFAEDKYMDEMIRINKEALAKKEAKLPIHRANREQKRKVIQMKKKKGGCK